MQQTTRIYRGLFTPSKVFIVTLLCWLFGLSVPSIPVSIYLPLGLMVASALKYLPTTIRLISLFIAAFFLANSYYQWYLLRITPYIDYGKLHTLTVTILEKPVHYDNNSRYIAETKDGWYIYLTLSRSEPIKPGSAVTLSGILQAPTIQDDEAYRLALAKKHIFAKISYPKILKTEPANLAGIEKYILFLQQHVDKVIHKLVVEPQAALFSGIMTGARSDLPPAILESFRTTGLSHFIAVSGYNITILMSLFALFTKRSGRVMHLILSVLLVLLFVLLTGASASVVRAGIFALLFVFAHFIGRKASLLRLLIFTAFLMSVVNPLIVRHDIGFQLSFAAVVGLILLAPRLERLVDTTPLPGWFTAILTATLAASLTTFPILAYHFGTTSPYSLLANLIVGPIIPLLTIAGMPLLLVAGIIPLGIFITWPLEAILRFIIWISQVIAQLPFAKLVLPPLPVVVWYSYYLLLSFILLLPRKEDVN